VFHYFANVKVLHLRNYGKTGVTVRGGTNPGYFEVRVGAEEFWGGNEGDSIIDQGVKRNLRGKGWQRKEKLHRRR